MSSEKSIDCQSHPFRDFIPFGEEFTVAQFDSQSPRQDCFFPDAPGVFVRNTEERDLKDVDGFPNGGFRVRKWMEQGEDGQESLRHYHVEILPKFDPDSINHINTKLNTYRIQERIEKAEDMSYVLPIVNICPEMGLSLAADDEHLFSFTPDGDIVTNKRRLNKFKVFIDGSVYRFGILLQDIIDTNGGENVNYKMMATGAIYITDLEEIKKMLDVPVALGTLRGSDKKSVELLASIARLDVSIAKLQNELKEDEQ